MKIAFTFFVGCCFLITPAYNQNWTVFDTAAIGVSGLDTSQHDGNGFQKIRGDKWGNVYVSVWGKGMFWHRNNIWAPFNQQLFTYTIRSLDIYDYFFDANDDLWVMTHYIPSLPELAHLNGPELHHIRDADNYIKTYSHIGYPLLKNRVFTMETDNTGNIWIGQTGLTMFDIGVKWATYMLGGEITNIVCNDDGTLLLSSISAGAYIFYTDSETWTQYDTSNSPLPANTVKTFNKDHSGNFWFATWGGGLAKLSGNDWQLFNTANSGLPSDTIHHMLIAADGNIWLATAGGLAKYNETNWTVYNTANSPLPSNRIHFLHADPAGNLWLTTDFHVSRIDNAVSSVHEKNNSSASFHVYPNPAYSKIFIHPATSVTARNTQVVIYDIAGKMVLEKKFISASSLTPFEIDVASLENGTYLLHVMNDETRLVRKLIVSR
jgi:hypothetical protein